MYISTLVEQPRYCQFSVSLVPRSYPLHVSGRKGSDVFGQDPWATMLLTLGSHVLEGYRSQFVCLCVTNLAPAYDVRATNWTYKLYQPGLRLTPKVFNLQISLKSFLYRVIASFSVSHRQGGHFQLLKLPRCQFN